MPDLRQRLRDLDALDVPDVMERAQRLGPKPPVETGPSPARRIAIVAFALLLAAVSLLYVTRAFDRSQAPLPASPAPNPQWSSECAWTTTSLPLPADDGHGHRAARLVAGTSMDDLWVMASHNAWVDQYLLHYDGRSWTEIPLPADLVASFSREMVAAAPNDLWVLAPDGVERFDGSTWTRSVPELDNAEAGDIHLVDLDVVAPDDAWAAGSVFDHASGKKVPLILHWDGRAWSRSYQGTLDDGAPTDLVSLSAWSSDDVWAAGPVPGKPDVPGALHWDGTSWTSLPVDRPGVRAASVDPFGLAAVGQAEVLMTVDEGVLRWDGSGWVDTGFGDAHSDVPISMARGTTGVWAALWNTGIARWDGETWRREPLKGIYAYGMTVIDDSAVFVGTPLIAKTYSC